MSDPTKEGMGKSAVKANGAIASAEGEAKPRGLVSWLLGWVLVPGLILGSIFGSGVLVGVHLHDSWLARLVVWIVELFA